MDKHDGRSAGEPGAVRLDDPWYDALAPGWAEPAGAVEAAGHEGDTEEPLTVGGPRDSGIPPGEIYLAVHRSGAFQEVRRRYRSFVVPATLAFLIWYLAYVVAAIAAPGLMARPLVGAFNVAMAAGLGQFATTFLLAWAYMRHARLRRDRAALEIRWETQELTGGNAR
ncbi:DUF485 domain-containing protein [Streptomyces endophytica]|uniref:DUF485 domain-containing protein n=1 Tax=Streptomyces endophytica TaxID=2991496 RepID=A0ABY6P612_9ACTN|nr:DUF485 domain-containing protein [Streptomyces endophytica]UZJ29226.1 DUF485 domain-containing protein [Streptomyces endophytica]